MKHLFLLATYLYALNCYAQGSQTNENMMDLKTIADSVGKYVKRYDYEPLYVCRVNTNASFEVLVNDKLMGSYFGPNVGGISFYINKAILQSGPQELKVIESPRYTDNATQLEKLDEVVEFELLVHERAWKVGGGMTEPRLVYSYNIADDKKRNPKFTELDQYSKTDTFSAQVPYQLVGWTKSKDLTKLNREQLLRDVETFYTQYRQHYVDKDVVNVKNFNFKRALEGAQATYQSKSEFEREQGGWLKFFDEMTDIVVEPLENYEMRFFGNGRMVALVRTDGRSRGESALRIAYRNELGQRRRSWLDLYLHIPEEGNKLEVIR